LKYDNSLSKVLIIEPININQNGQNYHQTGMKQVYLNEICSQFASKKGINENQAKMLVGIGSKFG
jgi:hypothetical protein